MSYRDRPTSTPVTAEANRLNQWAALASTAELRRELRADQPLGMSQQQARTRRLRELVLRVADLKQAREGA